MLPFLLLLLLLLMPVTVFCKNNTHINARGEQINLPENWVKTTIGELFYHTSFVFTNTETSDMLILESYPKGMIFNENILSVEPTKIKHQLRVVNKLNAHSDFLLIMKI